jgi:hypothetical protein
VNVALLRRAPKSRLKWHLQNFHPSENTFFSTSQDAIHATTSKGGQKESEEQQKRGDAGDRTLDHFNKTLARKTIANEG